MKRTGTSKQGKQYTYYCCEYTTVRTDEEKCDFMTWDVPVKDDCPACGHTMFKRAGKGFKKPFCINAACSNFLPEDKRGYPKKSAEAKTETTAAEEPAAKRGTKAAAKSSAGKKTTKATGKTAAKSTKKTAAVKTSTKGRKKKTEADT